MIAFALWMKIMGGWVIVCGLFVIFWRGIVRNLNQTLSGGVESRHAELPCKHGDSSKGGLMPSAHKLVRPNNGSGSSAPPAQKLLPAVVLPDTSSSSGSPFDSEPTGEARESITTSRVAMDSRGGQIPFNASIFR